MTDRIGQGDRASAPGDQAKPPGRADDVQSSATKEMGEREDSPSFPVVMVKGLGEAGYNATKIGVKWPAKVTKRGWDAVSDEVEERIADQKTEAERRAASPSERTEPEADEGIGLGFVETAKTVVNHMRREARMGRRRSEVEEANAGEEHEEARGEDADAGVVER